MTRMTSRRMIVFLSLLSGMWGTLFAQARETQREQLAAGLTQLSSGRIALVYHAQTGVLKYLGAEPGTSIPILQHGAKPEGSPVNYERSARRFLDSYGPLFGISDQSTELALQGMAQDGLGHFFVRFEQRYRGLRVFGGQVIVQLNPVGDLQCAVSRIIPEIREDLESKIPSQGAQDLALQAAAKWVGVRQEQLVASEPELSIFNPALFNAENRGNWLVWRIEVSSAAAPWIDELMLVRADNGRIILHFNQSKEALNRKIYDNRNSRSAGEPGWGPVRVEGQSPVDVADVDNTYDYMGDSYRFFQTLFSRDSLDGQGFPLAATVRYCKSEPEYSCPYNNAFWSSKFQQLFLGSRGLTDDTVAHELGHGFSSFTSDFFYFMQSGAIEESMADLWGEFVDQTNGRGNDSPGVRWLLFEDDPEGGPSRNMRDPNQFNHPATTADPKYLCSTKDNGGVHTNSGVGNKAIYLIADGDSFNGYTIRGLGLAKTAWIYYQYQRNLAVSGADYQDLHYGLQQACRNLVGNYGIVSDDCEQVRRATTAVGMTSGDNWCIYPKAPVCNSGTTTDIFFDDMEGEIYWEQKALSGPSPSGYYAKYYAASGKWSLSVDDMDKLSDLTVAMKQSEHLPEGPRIYLHFKHSYEFEFENGTMYDGGILEYSLDEGSSWQDAQSMFLENGYDGTIHTGAGNPLAGRRAFTGTSFGYTASRLDISPLAGRSVRFRFRTGSDEATGDQGWFIDDVRIYTCNIPSIVGTPQGFIDRPTNNEVLSGNVNVNGWAAVVSGSVAAPPARIDLYVDDIAVRQLISGTQRLDVQQYFRNRGIVAPDNLGFGGIWDSRTVPDGAHQLALRAADANAVSNELIAEIARISIRTNNGIATSTTTTVTSTTSTRPPGTSTSTSTSTSSSTSPLPTTSTTAATTTTTLPSLGAEPSATLLLATRAGEPCPGFYIGDVSLAAGARAGIWGIEIVLTAGQKLLQGGLNLGGAFEENGKNNAWGAFSIANPDNEPQEVRLRVDAQALPTPGFLAAALGLSVRIVDASRNQVGAAVAGPPPLQLQKVLAPGFYIVEVKSLALSPKGTFQLSAETSFVGRAGGGFQGGVVVGGHLTRDASNNSIHGFAAFCIGEAQNVSFKTFGAPSFGTSGAGNLVLAVKDSSQRIIWQSP